MGRGSARRNGYHVKRGKTYVVSRVHKSSVHCSSAGKSESISDAGFGTVILGYERMFKCQFRIHAKLAPWRRYVRTDVMNFHGSFRASRGNVPSASKASLSHFRLFCEWGILYSRRHAS